MRGTAVFNYQAEFQLWILEGLMVGGLNRCVSA